MTLVNTLFKKLTFPLKTLPVNVTKSAGNFGKIFIVKNFIVNY